MDFSKTNSTDSIHQDIDQLIQGSHPEELQQIYENREFIKQAEKKPIAPGHEIVKVFGVEDVNVNAILKLNVLQRSVFTVDELCEMFLAMTIEQLIKFQKKKRGLGFDMMWLILLLIGVPVAIVILIMFMGG